MTRFTYKAVDTAGFTREGALNASSRDAAVGQLYAGHLTPVALTEEKTQSGRASGGTHKLRQTDLVALVREIATLLSSGVGLIESFSTLHDAFLGEVVQD